MTIAEARMWVTAHARADAERLEATVHAVRMAVWASPDDIKRAFRRISQADVDETEAAAAALGLRIVRE